MFQNPLERSAKPKRLTNAEILKADRPNQISHSSYSNGIDNDNGISEENTKENSIKRKSKDRLEGRRKITIKPRHELNRCVVRLNRLTISACMFFSIIFPDSSL